ncbi:MAG: 50S ribosomal protein L18 [Chloroflexi bacterium]|nr:50S ribosomal protein L18 [Chloroflexota bacterium]
MIKGKDYRAIRLRRARRVRARIPVTAERPRLSVHRSNTHIYAQVVNDSNHSTLATASTLDPDLRGDVIRLSKKDQAAKVGELVAKRALAAGITKVAFDRGGFTYHGRIQALADAARQAGLDF